MLFLVPLAASDLESHTLIERLEETSTNWKEMKWRRGFLYIFSCCISLSESLFVSFTLCGYTSELLICLFSQWATLSEGLDTVKIAILTAQLCLSMVQFLEVTTHHQEANNNKSPASSKQFGWPRTPQLFLKVSVSDNFQLWLGLHCAEVSYAQLESTYN